VNGSRVKPAKEIHVGDTVLVRIAVTQWTIEVRALSDKRGPAKVAATLYDETPDSHVRREEQSMQRRLAQPLGADLGARPTKQDRRRLEALRRAQRRDR
jgi:ribosome-associated heat shock protein Hsp15